MVSIALQVDMIYCDKIFIVLFNMPLAGVLKIFRAAFIKILTLWMEEKKIIGTNDAIPLQRRQGWQKIQACVIIILLLSSKSKFCVPIEKFFHLQFSKDKIE